MVRIGLIGGRISLVSRLESQAKEIKQLVVKKMGRSGIGQCAKQHIAPSGLIDLPAIQNSLDLLTLQPILAAAEIAGNDRIIHRLGKNLTILFSNMGKGAVQKQIFLFIDQFGWHCGQSAAMKQVHEKCF